MPWQFTEELYGVADWILPGIVFVSLLNIFYTKRLPLILAWLLGFVLQIVARYYLLGTPLLTGLGVMSGLAFVLFTFFMVPDPATTPDKPLWQILFGVSVAALYGVFMAVHQVYGLFIALTLVCFARGTGLYLIAFMNLPQAAP